MSLPVGRLHLLLRAAGNQKRESVPLSLDIQSFLAASTQEAGPVIDVRAPAEFQKGHIPGAVSVPLFDDAERAEVGTLYKQEGRDIAVLKGLELVGPKMADFVRMAEALAPERKIRVHCWRGGMRSESMGWLWEKAGFSVTLLKGGYKAFRQHNRTLFEHPWKLQVLSGPTGSGKTPILHAMAGQGAQVLDLEGLARHKGSAFGGIGQAEQPSTEHFENLLAAALSVFDPLLPIWVEDESIGIGRIFVPLAFYERMQTAPVWVVDLPQELRIARLVREYALPTVKEELSAALKRIGKRL
ncbi:MAG: tRNA 2-selenouridine(34) synthase MnmH, partial [Bacteroidota bacterium]